MAHYYIEMDGTGIDRTEVDCATVDEARNASIILLGEYLQKRPDYAYEKHWRVDLKDHTGRLLVHVIVATVTAAGPLNIASYE